MAQKGTRIRVSTKITDGLLGWNQNVARIAQPTDGKELSTGRMRRVTA